MIVYLEDKAKFRADVLSNRIEEKIQESFRRLHGHRVGPSELASWKNSLGFIDRVLSDDDIPSDAGVAVEYGLPGSGKRIDVMITGTNDRHQRSAVIIELKQWSEAAVTTKDAIVSTFIGGAHRELSHPSYQAWSYAALLEDFNEVVQVAPVRLHPCAYLHNCDQSASILSPFYKAHTDRAPSFLKDDAEKLRAFIRNHVRAGDRGKVAYEISAGRIRPSKSLADSLLSLLKGNREFVLIDDQKLVYETALHLAQVAARGKKQTLIVEGGPGTGKSVVAINLLVELTTREKTVQYVTKNAAPRAVYESKLKGSFTKSRISSLFVGSGSFYSCEPDTFDALVIDEAHRLNRKSGMFAHLGENQIKELIQTSRLSVFFIDGAQRVTWQDIGDVESIREWAATLGSEVTELKLESQFRCNGSDGYLAWVDQLLDIRPTANPTLEGIPYEFAVCNSANELRDTIRRHNQARNKARMVAGYCWEWPSKTSPNEHDIVLPHENFSAQWNLAKDGSLWILQPGAVEQVGCIHTSQGLELDYIGVIFGPDLVIRNGRWIAFPNKRAKSDKSIKGFHKLALHDRLQAERKASEIIRNTYRTLMTRGQKGCLVYSVDPETNAYLKQASARTSPFTLPASPHTLPPIPFRILTQEEIQAGKVGVPCFPDLRAAAGSFSPDHSAGAPVLVELPEHFVARPGTFIVRITGNSMNRRIPNGAWCLFRANPVGSREGKVVLVQHRDIQDPETDGGYTVKLYRSQKTQTADTWEHQAIRLLPDSLDPSYQEIHVTAAEATDFRVLGEFIAIASTAGAP